MKKLISAILSIFVVAVAGAQNYPVTQNLGNTPNTLVQTNSIRAGQGIILGSFTDTAAANALPYLKNYTGAAIWCTADSSIYVRQKSSTAAFWFKIGGAGGGATGSYWSFIGNFFPAIPANFGLGTNDETNLPIKTNNITRLTIPYYGLSYMSASTDSILVRDASGNVGLIPKSGGGVVSAWELSGNSSTDPTTNWLGTNDSTGFRIKVNGKNAGYILQGGFNSGGGISYSRQFTSFGMLSGNKLIDDIIAGISDGGLNMLLGPGAGMNIGNTYDTTAGSPSDQNLIITNVGAGPYIQQNSFVTGNGRNVLIGESVCHSCLTPGENTAAGMFVMENAYRPTKNAVFGSSALRAANDASYMTSIGAYASHLTGCSISGVTITNGGSGYTTATVTFSSPLNWSSPGSCYTTATGTATISGGAIVGIVITNPGCGYSTLTGTYPNGGRTEKPIITITGDGIGFAGTPVVSCGDNTTTVGHAAGWLMKAPKYQIYIGSGSEPTAAYFDQYGGAIGTGAGRHSSVSTLTTLSNAWAIGTNAKVSTDRTLTIGAPTGDSTLKVAINNHTGDSTFSVYGGGLYIERGLRIGGFPQPNTSSKNYFSKVSSDGTLTNSRMIEITNATGNFISIDDFQTGATTTNNFLFNVFNNYTGDLTSATNPLISFGSRSSSVTDLNVIKMEAASMPTSSSIGFSVGKSSSLNNMFFWKFRYNGSGSTSNYIEQQFAANGNISRTYASGNVTIGNSVTIDNGYRLEVGGKTRVNDSLWVQGGVRLTGLSSASNATDSMMVVDASTGNVGYRAIPSDGGGWSPAGNFGNIQINRNGAFATPGSDSLDFEASTGLEIKAPLTFRSASLYGTNLTVKDQGGTTRWFSYIDGNNSPVFHGPPYWRFLDGSNEYFRIEGNDASSTSASVQVRTVVSGKAGVRVDLAGSATNDAFQVYNSGATKIASIDANGGSTWSGRVQFKQGADVASSVGAITLGGDGNVFEITGTSAITAINNTNWQNGATVTLLFTSTASLTHGTANSGTSIGFELAGAANFNGTAGDVVVLVLSEIGGTQRWRMVSQSVN